MPAPEPSQAELKDRYIPLFKKYQQLSSADRGTRNGLHLGNILMELAEREEQNRK